MRTIRRAGGAVARLASRLRARCERGATSIEYAIIAAAIAAVIILAVYFLGTATNDNFECTGSSYATSSFQC